jgi:signal transduction histidine kinase
VEGDGLLVPIRHHDLLGVVELKGIAAPDHVRHDHALPLTIAGVCGLAISNAREYEKVKRAEEARATELAARARAERGLHAAHARLLEADGRKNEFLAMLSHELRNPLAPIRNSIYILERATPGGEQATRAREVIDRQAQQLTKLIDDLLDVTRISRGKIRLQREPVELNRIVRGAGEDFHEVFRRNGIELDVSVTEAPLLADGDPTRIAQMVGNLLQNAAKFTHRGGHTSLTLDLDRDGRAVIQVRDDGVGIQPELLSELFEPFVQGDRTLDRSRGGLGLGLALVKGLADLHGGKVSVESEGPGKGALFTIRLPAEVDACAPGERWQRGSTSTSRSHRA